MRTRTIALGACLALLACDDSTTGPAAGQGTLEVSVTTSGGDPDLDGYLVTVGGVSIPIGVNGQETIVLPAGERTVTLDGVAPNCTVGGGGASRRVTVTEGAETAVGFTVTCALTGIQVQAISDGLDLDASGYQVRVDGSSRGAVAANGALLVSRLTPGEHVVVLEGVATNCQANGELSRTVTVRNGQLVPAAFSFTCGATRGVIRVEVTTTGVDLDEQYRAVLLSDPAKAVQVTTGSALIASVPLGTHQVRLDQIRPNCTPEDGNLRTATVTGGGLVRDTTVVTFAVTCVEGDGTLAVTTRLTGSDPDAEFILRLWTADCPDSSLCPETEAGTFELPKGGTIDLEMPAGSYYAVLQVNGYCRAPTPGSTDWFDLGIGATVELGFEVACGAAKMTVSVTAVGPNPDTEVTAEVWYEEYWWYYWSFLEASGPVPVGGSTTFELSPGRWYLARLVDVADNCTVVGGAIGPFVYLDHGQENSQSFTLQCS